MIKQHQTKENVRKVKAQVSRKNNQKQTSYEIFSWYSIAMVSFYLFIQKKHARHLPRFSLQYCKIEDKAS